MAIKLQKLDKRFDGHELFKYRATFTGQIDDRLAEFSQARNWMIDTYGKSNELELHKDLSARNLTEHVNPTWVWKYNEQFGMYIYLCDNDKLLNWFSLRWLGV